MHNAREEKKREIRVMGYRVEEDVQYGKAGGLFSRLRSPVFLSTATKLKQLGKVLSAAGIKSLKPLRAETR